ncbi:hypothetical protein [Alloactinosynnema sp. L-07]|uniref:hypothetical protein n=1 Tax=Alloactinosynnema sp. L-07 TaxID=1653480 RepID=UPI0012F91025|nr:hypothetical protein [Alloactinosynnema sp. L-07]
MTGADAGDASRKTGCYDVKSRQRNQEIGMWQQIGTTIRKAMNNWGMTARLCVCVCVGVLTAAAVVIIWVQAQV